jgi:capsular polysaccharide biosynthesis protein
MNVPLNLIRQNGRAQNDLRDHYESVTLETLRALWRQRLLIIGSVVFALATALTLITQLPRFYTAEALIQFDFLNQQLGTPSTATDADALLESYTRYISSRQAARKVAQHLASNPEAAISDHSSDWRQALIEAREMILPETVVTDPIEKSAAYLQKNLRVTNVNKAYLITVSFTARSAERAATVANAFAQQFFGAKHSQEFSSREAAAQQDVLKLSNTFGADHPSIIAAKEYLETIRSQRAEHERKIVSTPSSPPAGIIFAEARPVSTPSSPSGKLYFTIALLLGSVFGVGAALFAENRDLGFRNADEVHKLTGIPCVGVIPNASKMQAAEAMRILCIETGIIGQNPAPKVILISTPLDDDQTTAFAAHLAKIVADDGRRVLSIDTQIFASLAQPSGETMSPEQLLSNEKAFENLLGECVPGKPTIAKRNPGIASAAFWSVESFIAAARKVYDVVLIQTRPALTSSDALRLTPIADIHLHVVRWRHTRRHPTLLSIHQFRQKGARLSGVVLIETNMGRYRQYGAADRFYYLEAGETKMPNNASSGSSVKSNETVK